MVGGYLGVTAYRLEPCGVSNCLGTGIRTIFAGCEAVSTGYHRLQQICCGSFSHLCCEAQYGKPTA